MPCYAFLCMLSTYCGYAGLITTPHLPVALMNFFAAFLKLLTLVVIAVLSKLAAVVGVNSIAFIIVSFLLLLFLLFTPPGSSIFNFQLFSILIFNFQSSIFNCCSPVFVVSEAKIGWFLTPAMFFSLYFPISMRHSASSTTDRGKVLSICRKSGTNCHFIRVRGYVGKGLDDFIHLFIYLTTLSTSQLLSFLGSRIIDSLCRSFGGK